MQTGFEAGRLGSGKKRGQGSGVGDQEDMLKVWRLESE